METVQKLTAGLGKMLGAGAGQAVAGASQKEDGQEMASAEIYSMAIGEKPDGSINYHTILQIPRVLPVPKPAEKKPPQPHHSWETSYNIVMVDTSHSMHSSWKTLVESWNYRVAPYMDGITDVYSFSSYIQFKRNGHKLDYSDFEGRNTDLTGAIQEISTLVSCCSHKHVRVFLITDGMHTANFNKPEEEIEKMKCPYGKRVEMYLLGIRDAFPVEISISLRSKLHTGPANCPTLFWAKTNASIDEELMHIKDELRLPVRIELSKPAKIMPYLHNTKNEGYPGEYLYIDSDPKTVLSNLKLRIRGERQVSVHANWRYTIKQSYYNRDSDYHRHDKMMMMMMRRRRRDPDDFDEFDDFDDYGDFCDFDDFDRYGEREPKKAKNQEKRAILLPLSETIQDIGADFLLNKLFKQWCAILTQMHKNKQTVPLEVYDVMNSSFAIHLKKAEEANAGLQDRLAKKYIATMRLDLVTMINQSRNIISMESKFKNEIELAEAVLKTTVESKYDIKLLKHKGHGDPAWQKDTDRFLREYKKIEKQIKKVPEPSPEDCCRILLRSFLSDLQDDEFKELLGKGKMEFLSEVTFTGIPIFAPVKDSSQMNPWTQYIKNICNSPFEILSQRSMESAIANNNRNETSPNKEIELQRGDKRTVYNVIVPIIPREHAELLKPLVNTTVFAVGCTFCILKNALIVDHTCHIASLGCVWMKTIKDFPKTSRPEYIKNRILNVEATAKLYVERPSIKTYIENLLKNPRAALCTEYTGDDGVHLKCESLIKPCFFLHLSLDDLVLLNECQANIPSIIQITLMEFLGRCLTSYKSLTPYVDCFLPSVDTDKREAWLVDKSQEVFHKLNITGNFLLDKFYEPDAVKRYLKPCVAKIFEELSDELDWTQMTRHVAEEVEREVNDDDEDSNMSDDSDYYNYRAENRRAEAAAKPEDQPRNFAALLGIFQPNMQKIVRMRNSGSAGHVGWEDLRAWAQEMLEALGPGQERLQGAMGGPPPLGAPFDDGNLHMDDGAGGAQGGAPGQTEPLLRPVCLIQRDIDYAFGNDMMNVYLYHGIENRASKDRQKTALPTPDEAREKIKENIKKEWSYVINKELKPKVEALALESWHTAYNKAHSNMAVPLTKWQLIEEAQERGVADVTEENFDTIYQFRDTGLCTNCCHVRSCPWFLKPNKNFNAHIAVERKDPNYPHNLHLVVSRYGTDVKYAFETLKSGRESGTRGRNKIVLPDLDQKKTYFYIQDLQGKYRNYHADYEEKTYGIKKSS